VPRNEASILHPKSDVAALYYDLVLRERDAELEHLGIELLFSNSEICVAATLDETHDELDAVAAAIAEKVEERALVRAWRKPLHESDTTKGECVLEVDSTNAHVVIVVRVALASDVE